MRKRPKITEGKTEKLKIGCGNLYVTINADKEGLCEVFTYLGRLGGCPSQSEATARLISLALRSGIPVEEIVEQLVGIRCFSSIGKEEVECLSCPDGIGKVLRGCRETPL